MIVLNNDQCVTYSTFRSTTLYGELVPLITNEEIKQLCSLKDIVSFNTAISPDNVLIIAITDPMEHFFLRYDPHSAQLDYFYNQYLFDGPTISTDIFYYGHQLIFGHLYSAKGCSMQLVLYKVNGWVRTSDPLCIIPLTPTPSSASLGLATIKDGSSFKCTTQEVAAFVAYESSEESS